MYNHIYLPIQFFDITLLICYVHIHIFISIGYNPVYVVYKISFKQRR